MREPSIETKPPGRVCDCRARLGHPTNLYYTLRGEACQLANGKTERIAMATADLVLAMTGASGAPYGVRLLEVLLRAGRTVHLTLSPAGVQVIEQELDQKIQLERFELRDLI